MANKVRLIQYEGRSVEGSERRRVAARERLVRWRRDNPEKWRAQYRSYQTAHRDKLRVYGRDWYRKQPPLSRGRTSGYGLEVEQILEMLAKQSGSCAICRRILNENFNIDHDHRFPRGKSIRGILCQGCNQGVGKFQDKPEWLVRAAVYLRENSNSQ